MYNVGEVGTLSAGFEFCGLILAYACLIPLDLALGLPLDYTKVTSVEHRAVPRCVWHDATARQHQTCMSQCFRGRPRQVPETRRLGTLVFTTKNRSTTSRARGR
jgi:hypothetical protein